MSYTTPSKFNLPIFSNHNHRRQRLVFGTKNKLPTTPAEITSQLQSAKLKGSCQASGTVTVQPLERKHKKPKNQDDDDGELARLFTYVKEQVLEMSQNEASKRCAPGKKAGRQTEAVRRQ